MTNLLFIPTFQNQLSYFGFIDMELNTIQEGTESPRLTRILGLGKNRVT